MVNVLGIKRVVILGTLVGVTLLIVALLYGVFKPEEVKKQTELNQIKYDVTTVRRDLSNILIELEQLELQKDDFKELVKRRFFEEQDRRQAEEILGQIQTASSVISAKANISAGQTEDHIEAQKSEHKILISTIEINITALDDMDIFNYVWLLENKFPGYIDIQELSFERAINVDREVLQKISAGESPQIVKARIKANWKTMIAAANIVGDNGVQGGRR